MTYDSSSSPKGSSKRPNAGDFNNGSRKKKKWRNPATMSKSEKEAELSEISRRMNAYYNRIQKNEVRAGTILGKSLEHARKVGRLLMRVKKLLPHGEYEAWVKNNFDGGPSTARTYKQIAGSWDQINVTKDNGAKVSIRKALNELNFKWNEREPRDGLDPLLDKFEMMIAKWEGHVCQLLAEEWDSVVKRIKRILLEHYDAKCRERVETRKARMLN